MNLADVPIGPERVITCLIKQERICNVTAFLQNWLHFPQNKYEGI